MTDVAKLMTNQLVERMEQRITDQLGWSVYKEDLTLMTSFLSEEIESSGLSLQEIGGFIETHSDEIVGYGVALLSQDPPGQLGIGASITYAIYLIYMRDKPEEEFLAYLIRRRIPRPKMVLKQLQQINGIIPSSKA